MKKIRFVIVGCGAIAKAHLQAIALSEHAEVTVLVDKVLPRAQQLGSSFQVSKTVRDYQESMGNVDAAIVALPHHLHSQVTTDLLQNGIHVLVEKPLALNTGQCDAMIKAAKASKTKLAVGLARRFFDSSRFVKQVIESQMLGDIISFDFHEGIIYKWPIMSDFAFRKETGGGVLADIGVHILDLLLWWLGDYDSFEYYDDAMGGVEADCELHLKLKSGATGFVQLSRTRDLRNSCIIQGERGRLEIETTFNSQIKLKINDQSLNLTGLAISEGMAEESAKDIFSRQLEDFVGAIHHNRQPFIPGEEGKRTVQLIQTCYNLRQPLKHPWIFLDGTKDLKVQIES